MRITIVVMLILFLRCPKDGSYELHIGEPFYPLNQLSYARFLGTDVLRNQLGGMYRMKGVYTSPDADVIMEPMLRSYEESVGLKYALLSTELEAADGDLLEVSGQIIQGERRLEKIDVIQKRAMLVPEDIRIVRRSSRLKDIVQNEYQNIKDMLQKKITPEGSLLILPDRPRWFIVWSEDDNTYIISTRMVDLMYQAEVDVVLDGGSDRVKDLYAVEWFKGE